MESQLFNQLVGLVQQVAGHWPKRWHVQYSDAWIVLVFFWSVLQDRPRCWACDARHWPSTLLAGRALPSASRLSQRLRQVSFEALMVRARDLLPDRLIKCIDAKPLVVGGYSKDPDARRGRAIKGFSKGYKLFAVYEGAAVDCLQIGPMSRGEATVARQLVVQAGREHGESYLFGDSLYDSNELYRLAAGEGMQLVSRRQKPGYGLGHQAQAPTRLRSVDLLEGCGVWGRQLYVCRDSIEQRFGQAGNLSCGLGPLPNWVRRPHRVAMWVAAKLTILTCWNIQKQRLTA